MKSLPLVAPQEHGSTFGFFRNVLPEIVRSERRRLRWIRATRKLPNWDGAGTRKPVFCTVSRAEIFSVKNPTLTILDRDHLKEEAEVE